MLVGFSNIKNLINRAESMRTMEMVGRAVLEYRREYGSLPNEAYVNQYIEKIGAVRLGGFNYRAAWIEYGSEPNSTILAYLEKKFRGFVESGYIVLWLNGKVEWMAKDKFESILARQQSEYELQWLKKHMQKTLP